MNAVNFLILYAATLSWLAPMVLSGAAPTQHPRLTVMGWLAAVGTAISAWIAALVILLVGAIHALVTNTAPTFCVQTLGLTSAVHLSTTVATVLTVALLALTIGVALHTVRRVILTAQATRRSNHSHAEAVRLVGRPTQHPGLLAIDSERAAVYCVASGRHSAIIATTAALQVLDGDGLAAVLAHERAHLRAGHHRILALLNALAEALPRLPLMRAAAHSVPPLLEMWADDVAARAHGRTALLTSLVVLSTGQRLHVGALAAAGTAVLERVRRLSEPASARTWRTHGYMFALLLACAAPALAALLCS